MMTRKNFEALAEITANISNQSTRSLVASDQADYFEADNPNFNRGQFLKACGL